EEHDPARYESAAQHAIEFLEPCRKPGTRFRIDGAERADRAWLTRDGLKARRLRRGDRLDQRVPLAAVRTLALPLRALPAALGAAVDGLRFRQGSAAVTQAHPAL